MGKHQKNKKSGGGEAPVDEPGKKSLWPWLPLVLWLGWMVFLAFLGRSYWDTPRPNVRSLEKESKVKPTLEAE